MTKLTEIEGKLSGIRERADAVSHSFARDSAAIRADKDRTESWKLTAQNEMRASGQARLIDLAAEEERVLSAASEEIEQELFGLESWASEDAVMRFRDANERVSRLDPDDEAAALRALRQAKLGHDTTMAKAIFARANECGWLDVIDAYLMDHPSRGELYTALSSVEKLRADDVTRHYRYNLSAVSDVLPAQYKSRGLVA